jgi:hypothetical protein
VEYHNSQGEQLIEAAVLNTKEILCFMAFNGQALDKDGI